VQMAHMCAIPFENIDPLLGSVPSLAPEDVFEKLVSGRRGGYCFEHNALFGRALEALGYAPRAVLARVFDNAGRSGARSHHAFVVEAEGTDWLCDTGFGGHGALSPLRLDVPGPQGVPNGTYRVRGCARHGEIVLERQADEVWLAQYGFDKTPARAIDFEAANFLCARWEGAPFSTNLLMAFHAEHGRVALFNRALTWGQPPGATQSELASCGELERLLRETCGLKVGRDLVSRVWDKIAAAPVRR